MRMLFFAQLCFALFLATKLGESLSNSNVTEARKVGERVVSSDIACSWNCTVIESDFTKQCDPVFTKKRLITFAANYDLTVDKKCFRKETSFKTLSAFTENYIVWMAANNSIPSFSRGIQGVWSLTSCQSCYERGKVNGFCSLKPRRTNAFGSRDLRNEVSKSIEDLGFVISNKKDGRSSWLSVFTAFAAVFSGVCSLYFQALLCLFSPTLMTKNGIRYIALEGASPVSIRSFVGNNVFIKEPSFFDSSWDQRVKMVIFRLLFMVFFALLLAPGLIVINITPCYKCLHFFTTTHQFMILFSTIWTSWMVCTLVFLPVSTEGDHCLVCNVFELNPCALFGVDIPRRILNHLRIQPLILVKCYSLFVRGLQSYCKMTLLRIWRGSERSVIRRVSLLLIFLFTLPLRTILILLASLMAFAFGFTGALPYQFTIHNHVGAHVLKKLNRHSLFVRLPVVKACVSCLDFCVTLLCTLVAAWLSYFSSQGVLLTLLLAFTMTISFPEESLPPAACFLLVCYYLLSSYNSFTNKYHHLSLTIYNSYKTQTYQIAQEEVCTNATPIVSEDKQRVMKIPKELFDMACEELGPIREAICLLLIKVILILSFVFLVFFLTMQLDVGVKPITKTVLAVFAGLLPKIVAKYLKGESQLRIKALVIEEKAPKIVQEYLKKSLRANPQGHHNSGADTQEASLVYDNEENIAMLDMPPRMTAINMEDQNQ